MTAVTAWLIVGFFLSIWATKRYIRHCNMKKLAERTCEVDHPRCKPGECFTFDGRTSPPSFHRLRANSLRVVQWNIERGYKFERVADELKKLDADVITLVSLPIL